MCGRAAGVHRALGDTLVVEVGDLFPQVVILQQRRPATPGFQRVVGVVEPRTLCGGEVLPLLSPRRLTSADGEARGCAQIWSALIGFWRKRLPRTGRLVERRRLRTGCAGDVLRAVLLQPLGGFLHLVLRVFDDALDGLFCSAVGCHGLPLIAKQAR